MKKHQITLTAEQAGEVLTPILSVVMSMDSNRAQYWIGRKKKLSAEIRKTLLGSDGKQDVSLIHDWQNFYQDLGIESYFSGVRIPDDPGGFERVIIMAPGIMSQKAYDFCARDFKCWKWIDKNLDEIIVSDRTTKNGPYAIRIRDRVEADEELKNLSANDLKKQNILGITIEERLIFGLKYFKETGKHLDINNWTLCVGSRYADGNVPSVHWHSHYGEMDVYWYSPGHRYDYLRSRQAVP
jgi:hypothetical protein